ncbi:50S ribosomal protein L29 [Corynebacterium suedekumii]|nr:50S ribosomal protein L29 [Corynebacterium suedekumii]
MATGTPAFEYRELDAAELETRLTEAKEELFNLRFQLATGQLTNNRRLLHGQARHRPHLHRYPRA